MDVVRGSNRRRAAWSRNALMVVASGRVRVECQHYRDDQQPLGSQQQQQSTPLVRRQLLPARIWRGMGMRRGGESSFLKLAGISEVEDEVERLGRP